MTEWMAIDSAPKDGTPFLVAYVINWAEPIRERCVCWYQNGMLCGGPSGVIGFQATAWQPLPPMPEVA